MTQVATESQARPTIGDILLAHGFVSSDDLAAAVEEQQRTEQPLGQILVTRGSITRLELASALAEQWSMPPEPRRSAVVPLPMAAAARVIDDDTYAARVQSAVSDLARRVGAAEPLLAEVERRAAESVSPHQLDARLAEVRSRIELSAGRLEALESGLSTVAERLEEMTDGVEQAFADMQAGTGELAERLAVAASLAGAQPRWRRTSRLLAAQPDSIRRSRVVSGWRQTRALTRSLRRSPGNPRPSLRRPAAQRRRSWGRSPGAARRGSSDWQRRGGGTPRELISTPRQGGCRSWPKRPSAIRPPTPRTASTDLVKELDAGSRCVESWLRPA